MSSSLRRGSNQPKAPRRHVAGNGKVAGLRHLVAQCSDPPRFFTVSPHQEISDRFFPWTINVVGSGCSILIPKARIAFTVCMQSSLGRNPCRVHTPFERAAMITARCEMLLSPGTVISKSIRGARFTRNSIENEKGDTGYLMLDPR